MKNLQGTIVIIQTKRFYHDYISVLCLILFLIRFLPTNEYTNKSISLKVLTHGCLIKMARPTFRRCITNIKETTTHIPLSAFILWNVIYLEIPKELCWAIPFQDKTLKSAPTYIQRTRQQSFGTFLFPHIIISHFVLFDINIIESIFRGGISPVIYTIYKYS
jgi:hypothetical protein